MEHEPLGVDAFALGGRTAVVTGAAQGIGQAIALAFAGMGADVAVCDRDGDGLGRTVDAINAMGRQSVAEILDVRDPVAVRSFVTGVVASLGNIDVLVNNAGGGFRAPFLQVAAKGEDALIRENFTSVASFVREVVPHMPPPASEGRGGGGSIIMITSIEAHRAGPEFAVYSAMKAAITSLVKSLALELGAMHVRVNAIAPDVIPTPGIGGAIPVSTPLPYAGHVHDVAAAAVFLASDSSAFVTGSTIHVDGGNLAAGGWYRDGGGAFATR